MGKVEQNKRQKLDSLLDAAFSLFTANGFNKTSISDIAKSAGVAKGTFYLYFQDKFDLRNKVIAHQADQVLGRSFKALDFEKYTELEDQIIFLTDHILNQMEKNHSLVSFLSKHLGWGIFKNNLLADGGSHPSTAYTLYADLINRTDHSYKNPEMMLYLIIEFVSGASYNAILYNQPMSLEKMKPEMYEVIRFIIRQHKIKN